jgi:hypothetical protein
MNKPDPDSPHQKMIDFLAESDRIVHVAAGLLVLPPASSSRAESSEIGNCTCIPHIHPEDPRRPGAYESCPDHPDRPGGH